jgi:hypothetical protein
MSYGITFWGASPHSINIFRLQTQKNNHKYQEKRSDIENYLVSSKFFHYYVLFVVIWINTHKT